MRTTTPSRRRSAARTDCNRSIQLPNGLFWAPALASRALCIVRRCLLAIVVGDMTTVPRRPLVVHGPDAVRSALPASDLFSSPPRHTVAVDEVEVVERALRLVQEESRQLQCRATERLDLESRRRVAAAADALCAQYAAVGSDLLLTMLGDATALYRTALREALRARVASDGEAAGLRHSVELSNRTHAVAVDELRREVEALNAVLTSTTARLTAERDTAQTTVRELRRRVDDRDETIIALNKRQRSLLRKINGLDGADSTPVRSNSSNAIHDALPAALRDLDEPMRRLLLLELNSG